MKKIVMLPLDERPCNSLFPSKLFNSEDIKIVIPEKLGNKKQPADYDYLCEFLKKECRDGDGLVVSMDMLLYGGLLPSRLHTLTRETVIERLDILRHLKKLYPNLTIYAFACIMRCPVYSSSDEEPDYYEQYGEQIHICGNKKHRYDLGLVSKQEMDEAFSKVPSEVIKDYTDRRVFNLSFNIKTLDLLLDNTIEFLIIPQDDSAPYGYTTLDQQVVRQYIDKNNLSDKVFNYPGADEVGLTLLSRMLLHLNSKNPKAYVKYVREEAKNVIPIYEDRELYKTIDFQLKAAGYNITDNIDDCDLVLAITAPGGKLYEAWDQPINNDDYNKRNLKQFILEIKELLAKGKLVTICDNAYGNGGDLKVLEVLNNENMLDKVTGYAGWNTSSNSMGTAIAQGSLGILGGKCLDFLMLRYVEDCGYCAVVRANVNENYLPGLNMNYFDVHEKKGIVSKAIKRQLEVFIQDNLSSLKDHIFIEDVAMPWIRMFEVDLTVSYK